MVNARKREIVRRLCECFGNYKQVVVVSLDNVATNQIHAARSILSQGEHKGEMIIGKNVSILHNSHPKNQQLIPDTPHKLPRSNLKLIRTIDKIKFMNRYVQ